MRGRPIRQSGRTTGEPADGRTAHSLPTCLDLVEGSVEIVDTSDHVSDDTAPMDIERLQPEYRYRIAASARISAPRAAVWEELLDLRMSALPIGFALTRLRHLPGVIAGTEARVVGSDRFLDATPIPVVVSVRPFLVVLAGASRAWKLLGGGAPPRLDAQQFKNWREDGWIKVSMQFQLTQLRDGAATLLVTETRMEATDRHTARSFAPYWWAIRAGSVLIRREVVARVKARVEASPIGNGAPAADYRTPGTTTPAPSPTSRVVHQRRAASSSSLPHAMKGQRR
jgi:hypothetical protein